MGNLFNYLNNYINSNSQLTYGDILENNNKSLSNKIQNICSTDEYNEYCEIKNKDTDRLVKEDSTNLKDNYLMGMAKKNQNIRVCGIGEVQYVC